MENPQSHFERIRSRPLFGLLCLALWGLFGGVCLAIMDSLCAWQRADFVFDLAAIDYSVVAQKNATLVGIGIVFACSYWLSVLTLDSIIWSVSTVAGVGTIVLTVSFFLSDQLELADSPPIILMQAAFVAVSVTSVSGWVNWRFRRRAEQSLKSG